jgi:hypothetical protein
MCREENEEYDLAQLLIKDYDANKTKILDAQLKSLRTRLKSSIVFGFYRDLRLGDPWDKLLDKIAKQSFEEFMSRVIAIEKMKSHQ